MRKYKALLLDLDGTCTQVGISTLPNARVAQAVNALVKRGVPVAAATGRNISQAVEVIKMLGIDDPCMLSNGALIYDPPTKKILESTLIDKESLEKIYEIAKDNLEKFIVADPYENHPYSEGGYGEQVAGLFIEKLTKEKAQWYVDKLKLIPTLSVHRSAKSFDGVSHFVSINNVRATKQRAVQHLLQRLDIAAEDVVAVGDGENDMPMIIAAGMGVAMGNAGEGLKAVADYIAPTVDEDGVVHVIDKFFPEG